MVLGCGTAAGQSWTSSTAWRGWPVEWLVCTRHYDELLSDRDWELVHGEAPTWHPWILMGDDIGTEADRVDDHLPVTRTASGLAPAERIGSPR